uniref:Uncharacterized protein n=1 Tax=Cannabis sativa TaxID=3483 RepID=A0A803PTQ1_CANSA
MPHQVDKIWDIKAALDKQKNSEANKEVEEAKDIAIKDEKEFEMAKAAVAKAESYVEELKEKNVLLEKEQVDSEVKHQEVLKNVGCHLVSSSEDEQGAYWK